MDTLTDNHVAWAVTLILVGIRLSGIFLVAPVFGHSAVPVKLRVLMVMVISLAIVGRMNRAGPAASGVVELALAASAELLVGLGIGYAGRLIFVAVELGAFHVAQQMGLALGEVFDPLRSTTPGPVRMVFAMLAVAIFLLIGGHRALIVGLCGTFETVAPVPAAAKTLLGAIVPLLGASFALGLKVAGPVLVTMLLVTVAMGLLQKTLPQCNLLSTHLPIRSMVGMVVLAASLGVLLPLLGASVDYLMEQIAVFTKPGA